MNVFELIRELQEAVAEARAEIARLKSDHDHAVIHGPVTDIDAEKQLCRIQIGVDDDGNPVKSPWRPYGQIAGKRKVHSPPSKGQQLTLISPCGDIEQGIALPFTWSDNNPSPSKNKDEDVDLRGKTRRTQRDADLKQEVDGVTFRLSKQSKSVVIHKDEQNSKEVDDKHPWEGNKGATLHSFSVTKDDGWSLNVNVGDDEHKITIHPKNGVTHSVNKGDHMIEITRDGIKHKSNKKVTIEAGQIEHNGSLKVSGSILAGKVIQSARGFKGALFAGFPGDPGDADTW
jgi:phage baseplate assembly protein gpV